MSRLTASRAAFDLIASFEGFRTRAVKTPSGKWTLGFGHTATAREGLTVTRAEAEDLLRWDLLPIEDSLRQVALTPLTQTQFDALVSFAFNIGLENFKNSDVLKFLNQGQPIAAALSMHAWRKAKVNGRVITIDALVRRRAAESALFLETTGARPAAPTPVVFPVEDSAATLSPTTAVAPAAPQSPATPTPLAPVKVDAAPVSVPKPIEAAQQPTLTPAAPKVMSEAVQKSEAISTLFPNTVEKKELTEPSKPVIPLPSISGPVVPQGLSPFPGAATYMPANGSNEAVSPAANDGHNTRLHNAPEVIETPAKARKAKVQVPTKPIDRHAVLTWVLLGLGAMLLSAGLFFAWKSGILAVTNPRREPTAHELGALLAAVSGFVILLASSVAAIMQSRGSSEEE